MTSFSVQGLREHLLLYAITDRSWLCGRNLSSCVQEAIDGGATFVQLREKNVSPDEFLALARELKPICEQAGVPFVINDNVDVALAIDADGVHVGQSDMACEKARALLGPDKIVGVSAQTVAQALAAQQAGADYLGVGALLPTATKPEAEDVTKEELCEICRVVDIPVVGIGGLNASTIAQFKGTGMVGAAVVSAIFAAPDCKKAAATLRKQCERTFV